MTGHDEKPRRRDGWWLLLIVYTALLVRGYVPHENVFGAEQVRFQGHDAWYHMRLIDSLIHNFPRPLAFDPYAAFPGGQEVSVAPFLDLVVALLAWLLGFGSPSERLVDTIAAWVPAVLGALTPLAVYWIGRRIFDRRAGLLAAGLLAVQPGQFLMRSLLGFVDHHVVEALLSTVTVWLLLVAVDRATHEPVDARAVRRAAAGAGLTLGAYLLSWGGGSLLIAIFLLWLAVLHLLDHLAGRSTAWLGRLTLPLAGTAFMPLLPFWSVLPRAEIHAAALAAFATAPFLLRWLAWCTERLRVPRTLYPVILVAAAAMGWFALRAATPTLTAEVTGYLARFVPSDLAATVGEAQPLFADSEAASPLDAIWRRYRLAFFLGLAGLLVLSARIVRTRAQPADTLLLVWSLAMFAATLAQNRFGYYLDINLCLLIGMLCRLTLGPLAPSGWPAQHPWLRTPAAVGLVLAAFLPTLAPVLKVARQPRGPGLEWFDAMHFLRHQTPEPLGDSAGYLERVPQPSSGSSFPYPEEAYGVLSWWDFGYWITRIGRRIPTANPTQRGAETAARFFTATDEATAVRVLEDVGARYVVTHRDFGAWPDARSGMVYGLFPNMTVWAGKDIDEYYDVFWEPDPSGVLRPTFFYYPAFYQSMATRLVMFGDEAAFTTDASWVIDFREESSSEGSLVKQVVAAQQFRTYEQAREFLTSQTSGNWRLVGRDPRYPCVPLQPLLHLRQIHQVPRDAEPPQIRILELTAAPQMDVVKDLPKGIAGLADNG